MDEAKLNDKIKDLVEKNEKRLYDCGMRRISMLLKRDTTIDSDAKTIITLVGCLINQQAYTRQGFAR